MRFRNDNVDGALLIEDDLQFAGLATGTVRVTAGATLLLTGTAGNLSIEAGGRAIVNGTVIDTVMNSGELEVSGCVGRIIDVEIDAITYVMPGAMIGGAQR